MFSFAQCVGVSQVVSGFLSEIIAPCVGCIFGVSMGREEGTQEPPMSPSWSTHLYNLFISFPLRKGQEIIRVSGEYNYKWNLTNIILQTCKSSIKLLICTQKPKAKENKHKFNLNIKSNVTCYIRHPNKISNLNYILSYIYKKWLSLLMGILVSMLCR